MKDYPHMPGWRLNKNDNKPAIKHSILMLTTHGVAEGEWDGNEWGLWTDSELKNELKKKGFEHPDDMSNYIIEEFIKYWNNKI